MTEISKPERLFTSKDPLEGVRIGRIEIKLVTDQNPHRVADLIREEMIRLVNAKACVIPVLPRPYWRVALGMLLLSGEP